MNRKKIQNEKVSRREARTRKRVVGSRPRLTVFRSNAAIYAQIIDDSSSKTLAAASSKGMKKSGIVAAQEVGNLIAQAAKKAKIDKVVFDRGRYAYHGQIKALAEAARGGGLKF